MMILTLLAAMVAEPELPACEPNIATPITVDQLVASDRSLIGTCVAVQGWTSGGTLLQSVEDYYRYTEREDFQPKEPRQEVGIYDYFDFIYGDEVFLSALLLEVGEEDGPEWVSITGAVGHCDVDYDDDQKEPNEPVVVMTDHSYCGWSGTVYIKAHTISIDRSRLAYRLTDQSLRGRLGNLEIVSANDRSFAKGQEIATSFFQAMRRRDYTSIKRHFGMPIGSDLKSSPFHHFFENAENALAFSRSLPVNYDAPVPQFVLFRFDAETRQFLDTSDRDLPFDVMCFCKTGDCSTLWPLNEIDARNRDDRPFACAQIVSDEPEKGEDDPWSHRVVAFDGFLPEPPESAYDPDD